MDWLRFCCPNSSTDRIPDTWDHHVRWISHSDTDRRKWAGRLPFLQASPNPGRIAIRACPGVHLSPEKQELAYWEPNRGQDPGYETQGRADPMPRDRIELDYSLSPMSENKQPGDEATIGVPGKAVNPLERSGLGHCPRVTWRDCACFPKCCAAKMRALGYSEVPVSPVWPSPSTGAGNSLHTL